jgi:periplasmic copper chaperone A
MMRKFGLVAACALVLVLLDAGVAAAHVTVSPQSLPQGTDDAILTFRVPNESATAAVTGLKIQFPLTHPIVLVNPEAGSGWQVNVIKSTLPKPITTDDGTFTSTTSQIDWSGSTIPVGQFGEFNVLAQGVPSGTSQLVFKAIQTYSDGTVVSWIEVPSKAVPDPEHPAPIITLTKGSGAASTAAVATAPTSTSNGSTSSGTNAWEIAALILAGFAIVLSVLAVWLGRPRLD